MKNIIKKNQKKKKKRNENEQSKDFPKAATNERKRENGDGKEANEGEEAHENVEFEELFGPVFSRVLIPVNQIHQSVQH